MTQKNLFLALTATLAVLPAAAQASDGFLSRLVTEPDGHGRWVNRRLTIRHHDQDKPSLRQREERRREEWRRERRDERGRRW